MRREQGAFRKRGRYTPLMAVLAGLLVLAFVLL
jgi:hypothetical protein